MKNSIGDYIIIQIRVVIILSGVMTLEESREAYADFRRRMGTKDGEDRDHRRDADRDRGDISDDCLALRRKLGAAVRNGEMTREEAGKIWEDEGC